MSPWETWLASLSDKAFFELYRHYIGAVQTPYHKQNLIVEFSSWIGKDVNTHAILEQIDKEEAWVLSLIYYQQGNLSLLELNTILKNDYSSLIMNLEERLLVYRNPCLNVNPLLTELLKDRKIIHPIRIIRFKTTDTPFHSFTPTDSILTAMLIFFRREDKVFLNHKLLSKKVQQDFIAQFGDIFTGNTQENAEAWLKAFLSVRLLEQKDDKVLLGHQQDMEAFAKIDHLEKRLELLTSLCHKSISQYAYSLLLWLKDWNRGSFPQEDWRYLLFLFAKAPKENQVDAWELWMEFLLEIGFLILNEGCIYPQLNWLTEPVNPEIPPLIQPNGDIHLTPDTPFCWALPYTTEISAIGSFVECHISRKSFKQGCYYHIRSSQWIESLEKATGYPLDPTLKVLIDEWDKDLYAMSISNVYLLELSKEKAGLVVKSEKLNPYFIHQLSETQWILSGENKAAWMEELSLLGISYFPDDHRVPQLSPKDTTAERRQLDPPVELDELRPLSPEIDVNLESELDPTAYRELQNRRERKLLLKNHKINLDLLKGEIRQAKGLDYNAKMRLLETALVPPREHLVVQIPGEDFDTIKLELDPQELIKKGGESILRAVNCEDSNEIIIPVRRMLQIQRFPKCLI